MSIFKIWDKDNYFFSSLQVSSSIFDKKWVFLSNILDEMYKTLVN